jgi:hypothetical protein
MFSTFHSSFSFQDLVYHLFDLLPVLSETQKNPVADHERRGGHPAVPFDKLFPGGFVRTDILVGELNPSGRKKIFQCMTVGSVRSRIENDFSIFFHFHTLFNNTRVKNIYNYITDEERCGKTAGYRKVTIF